MKLGYELVGSGANKVIVLHDWFSDHSSYTPMFPYLNQKDFQFAFLDVRGYGQSKAEKGMYTLDEASQDVLDTADALKWDKFHLVGFSMTGLIGQNILALAGNRVKSMIAICSVGANGYEGAGEEMIEFMSSAALGDDEKALQIAYMMTNNRYDREWSEFKVRKWRETSTADARAGYLQMFVRNNIVSKVQGLKNPILVVCTSDDAEGLRRQAMEQTFGKWFPNVEYAEIANSGHYPMQETPASLATTINKFLASKN
jgi:pimeloyl-ACP methyl ester carboxylesterase